MSVRLTEEDEQRLEKTAKLVRLSKHGLAELAIRAAVEAIEANGGKIVLPLEFTTTHEAIAKPTPKPAAPTVMKTGPIIYSYPEPEKLHVADIPATGSDS